MTAPATFALAIAASVIGLLVGIALGRSGFARRRSGARGPTAAELLDRFVRSSNNGVLILNRFGDLVLHNRRAEALGLVRANQADVRARKAAEQVAGTEEPTEIDLSPLAARSRGPAAVLGEVRPLGDGFTVVEAVDHSEAVRLEATRRDFVANVSHELKTPVGAMALLAEAVLDAADDPEEVRRFSEKILRESTRLGRLVTELIALSRLQGAEKLPELTVVDVDAVVAEALSRTRLAAESADIEITTDSVSDLRMVGDHTLLVTALSNLLDNAVAYSTAGSPVSISRTLVDGAVEISVTDRGIGIAEADQKRVFERFYRADKARSRATGGTGLGLAIVKHVAANHGGDVRLWSSPGVGSTFTLRIPAHLTDEAPGNGTPRTHSADDVRLSTSAELRTRDEQAVPAVAQESLGTGGTS
ncbi:sensor histidine kinase [Saccharomonospora azurea]|uniref:Sensor-like histidine kinase SenX3 n=1 Tax=Saccharomonospora azurea NA-128 TaxID=882081 RepID=H8GE13_9PSEU|nr:ATP-binding protein [Saccharomonospora azurea]EHK86856.1 histidine kinase [Saccharomonospora azurea SZMC 14600]EHY89928.1 histidine kinase [Saccharomonospora azurea NA-128]